MGESVSFDESSEKFMAHAIAALDEALSTTYNHKRLSIAAISAIAQKHGVETVDLLAQLEHHSKCTVDWQRQEVVCK
jgi:folylpolyglutamate synthase/dihydropteroate synthase